MADTPIPISDLPEAVPGDADYIGGSQLGNTRKFRVDQLPVPAALQASTGSALVGFKQSGTGAVARTALAKAREFTTALDNGATGDGSTDDTTDVQSALDDYTDVHLAGGSYKITAALDVGPGTNLRGPGAITSSGVTKQLRFDGACEHNVIEGLALDGDGSGFATTADQGDTTTDLLNVVIRNNHATNIGSLAYLSANSFSGRIHDNYVDTCTGSPVVRIGWNDYTNSSGLGPVDISRNVFKSVYHGPLTYSPYSNVSFNFIKNVGDVDHDTTNGIYTKARHSIVSGNIIVDGGYGQGAINMKGSERGVTDTPLGYAVTCIGNNISYTASYLAASSTPAVGIKCDSSEQVVLGNIVDGASGSAFQTGGEFNNLTVAFNQFYSADGTSTGLVYAPLSAGYGHRITGNNLHSSSTGNLVRLAGAEEELEIEVSGNILNGGDYGVYCVPSVADTLTTRITNNYFRNQATRCVYSAAGLGVGSMSRLRMTDNDFSGMPAAGPFDFNTTVNEVYIKGNSGLKKTTTDATTTTICELPMAANTVNSVRIRTVGSDGTDYLVKVVETAFLNTAGTVTEVGTATVVHTAASAGAATWTATTTVQTNGTVLFRVKGAAAKTIDWKVDITVIG